MKKLVYLLIILASILLMYGLWSSYKEYNNMKALHKDSTIIADPFEIKGDYSHLDSIDRIIKTYSYREYGDSNALTDGLADSIMREKDSIERLKNNWLCQ